MGSNFSTPAAAAGTTPKIIDPATYLNQLIEDVRKRTPDTTPVNAVPYPFPVASRPKIIFDTDLGSDVDDALALLLLMHLPQSDYELLGITTVYGCSELRTLVTRRILEAAGWDKKVPLICGVGAPLTRDSETVWHSHTEGRGLCTEEEIRANFNTWKSLTAPHDEAARFIIEQVQKYPGQVIILALGALSNVALALRIQPDIASKIHHIAFMGSGVRCTHENPRPEYRPVERHVGHRSRASHNIRCDIGAAIEPTAHFVETVPHLRRAPQVFGNVNVRVQVVSNDVTCRCWLQGLHSLALFRAGGRGDGRPNDGRGPGRGRLYVEWLNYRASIGQGVATCPHDPLTLAEALYPSRFVRYVPGRLLIHRETAETDFVVDTSAAPAGSPAGPARHWLGVAIDQAAFHGWLDPLLTMPRQGEEAGAAPMEILPEAGNSSPAAASPTVASPTPSPHLPATPAQIPVVAAASN
ncbi:putative nucleoside hydrolase [Paratrimastix pyriformis]|uniref:Nucleoside hydrolase n=1 Tax=Paratrimastix pyriformis TaxID=342808 RepID=A0ABQ8UEM3_9EUKA|nr:putative nucleoside hydrolase [Paratrimastix pyriformis]